MAFAALIRRIGPGFSQLAITDTDGKEWTYERREPARPPHIPFVIVERDSLRFVVGMDQRPVLRQTEPGLPTRFDGDIPAYFRPYSSSQLFSVPASTPEVWATIALVTVVVPCKGPLPLCSAAVTWVLLSPGPA
jgi:hypothetical protein